MDRIYIRDLEVDCVIGINPEERDILQKVIINVTLDCDLSPGTETDQIDDTLDYKGLKKAIYHMVKDSRFGLIEKLAQQVVDTCMRQERVQRVVVSVDKPEALRFARSVAVELTRER